MMKFRPSLCPWWTNTMLAKPRAARSDRPTVATSARVVRSVGMASIAARLPKGPAAGTVSRRAVRPSGLMNCAVARYAW
jgi:hypothetical protein